jgi:serine phosphatase RsbU (regulator of sigma subunit)
VYQVVLIEDDAGDALIVEELLRDADERFEMTWAASLTAARPLLAGGGACVLLDLGLPDAEGLSGLREVLRLAPAAPVVVLTGFDNKEQGMAAVAAGAQDYLVKGEVDTHLLARSLRYAMERKRADEAARRLHDADLRRHEARRLERGLLPRPLVRDEGLSWEHAYRPGGGETLLGGDFFDAIETADGALRVVIGDVCGHGPDEAALGVSLRIAWRTLVLAGFPAAHVLPALEDVLRNERFDDALFATACELRISADRRSGSMWVAGHPAPLSLEPVVCEIAAYRAGPPLGVVAGAQWEEAPFELPARWSLLLYTDGLIEGGADRVGGRLGETGLVELLHASPPGEEPGALVDRLIATAERLNRGPLPDDVAMLLLTYRPAGRG